MTQATVRVVGLGPADRGLVTDDAWRLITSSPVVRLRTRRHPAASTLDAIASYDEWYDTADSFDELYRAIADDLARLAAEAGEVVYAVPGSPVVAERTVVLLREDPAVVSGEVAVAVHPALGRWGLGTSGLTVVAPALPSASEVTGSTTLTAPSALSYQ